MSVAEELGNYYLEFDGKGENPRDHDLDDFEQRKRGKAFRARMALRDELDKQQAEAIRKIRES